MATTTMIKPCDICGDHGVIEAIIVCSECKVSREHLYCMRVYTTQPPKWWRCDVCDQDKLVSPRTSADEQNTKSVSTLMQQTTLVREGKNKNHRPSQFNFKEKRVDKGRTKYLSCDEAAKLSSGSMKLNCSRKEVRSPPRVCQHATGLKENAKLPARERTQIKSPKTKVKPNLQQPVVQQSPVPKGCKNHADVEAGRSDAGKPNLTSGLSVSDMHDPYLPSSDSYWKGCFYLPKGPQKFNEEFKAHPPSRVHYKVYETTKKLPENIYFELVSNHEIAMEIFPADRDDIGLYFFPMCERRSENDISIIDFMWRNNLAMKSRVEGLQLFVLSSLVLPSHAQEFEGNYFLWGVFRCPKTAKKVADTLSMKTAKHEPCDDVPPGFKRICNDVPPGFKRICDDVPPGFKRICKR